MVFLINYIINHHHHHHHHHHHDILQRKYCDPWISYEHRWWRSIFLVRIINYLIISSMIDDVLVPGHVTEEVWSSSWLDGNYTPEKRSIFSPWDDCLRTEMKENAVMKYMKCRSFLQTKWENNPDQIGRRINRKNSRYERPFPAPSTINFCIKKISLK